MKILVTSVPYMKVAALCFAYAGLPRKVSGLVGLSWNSPLSTDGGLPEVVDLSVVDLLAADGPLSPEDARRAEKERSSLEKVCKEVNGLGLRYDYSPEGNRDAERWFRDLTKRNIVKDHVVLKWLLR